MVPPAKRRRRQNIVESDDEDNSDTPKKKNSLAEFFKSPNGKPIAAKAPAPAPSSSLPSRIRLSRAPTRSPSTSPEKSGRKATFDDERGKSADLKTMFSKQVQRKRPATSTATSAARIEELDEDPISEGDEDDDDVPYSKASSTSIVGQAARKRLKTDKQYSLALAPTKGGTGSRAHTSSASSNSIFLKPPLLSHAKPHDDDEDRPWSERFAPVDLEELAVHKKKVSDVRQWLDAVINGRLRQRLLVLKGAAGTGKTTTVRLLAKELQCDLLEWRNPAGSGLGFVSFSRQFEEFMAIGGKFGQLTLDSDSEDGQSVSHRVAAPGNDQHEQKLILIEEFPNTFVRSSAALLAFRNAILGYLANNTPSLSGYAHQKPAKPITPVVMVISETLLTTTSASADSFTAHRLLGPEILQHPGTALIEFNNIAPTILSKALELVVRKEARKSGRRRTPGPQVLKKLGEIGDIRSAISALQFLCIKGDNDSDWGAKVSFAKSKRGAKTSQNLTKGEEASLELVTQREASLGIFHAVGKVVYNKRHEEPLPPGTPEALAEALPPHLSHAARPNKSMISVDRLIDETGTDTGTFISALHENYALSCVPTGPEDMNSSLDYISDCLEYLSASDMLCPAWDIFFGGKGPSGGFNDTGSHILRQDEMGFQVAVRGLLHSLPQPVKRLSSGLRGKGADPFKMFFPTSIKLWRTKEEMEGMLDMWASKLLHGGHDGQDNTFKGIMDGAATFRRAKPQGVEGWANNHRGKRKELQADKDENTVLLSLGSSARKEMVLERLPYMAHIARARKGQFAATMGLRDIEKVVSFQAGSLRIGDDDDDDDSGAEESAAGPSESWATDMPAEEALPRKGRTKIVAKGETEVPGAVGQDLFLSFDDIED